MTTTSAYRLTAYGLGLVVICVAAPAFAASFEEIVANCRNKVGRPIVLACMNGQKGPPTEACRAKASPGVKACVQSAFRDIGARKGSPTTPTLDEDKVADAMANSGAATFVAPPRTIADITAILDNEKPDAAKIKERQEDADAQPPTSGSKSDLAEFYYDRGNARALLARDAEALADGLKALESASGQRQVARVLNFVGQQYGAVGNWKKAIEAWQRAANGAGVASGARGSFIAVGRQIATALVMIGDLSQADGFARQTSSRVVELRGNLKPDSHARYKVYGNGWESDDNGARALIFESRGQFKEAEAAYKRAYAFRKASLKDIENDNYELPPPPEQVTLAADRDLMSIARTKAQRGRKRCAQGAARGP